MTKIIKNNSHDWRGGAAPNLNELTCCNCGVKTAIGKWKWLSPCNKKAFESFTSGYHGLVYESSTGELIGEVRYDDGRQERWIKDAVWC